MASGHYRTFYSDQRGYGKALKDSKLRIKELEKLEKDYNNLGLQISELSAGIYDTPKPPEVQEIEGWVAYLLSGNIIEASIRCKIPIGVLQKMGQLNGWDLDRKDFYDKVKLSIKSELEERSMPKIVDLVAACISRAFELANTVINSKDLNELDKAEAVKTLAETALMLQGEKREETMFPGLSAKANSIFVQMNQFMDKNEDIVDVTNDSENT